MQPERTDQTSKRTYGTDTRLRMFIPLNFTVCDAERYVLGRLPFCARHPERYNDSVSVHICCQRAGADGAW